MPASTATKTIVGIVANPASGRDVRRLVAKASVFPTSEKCAMIQRALAAMGAVGVQRVLMMPDLGGISAGIRLALDRQRRRPGGRWPELEFLDMPIEDTAADSVRAVERMRARGAGVILVMGGDGTHRVVASRSGDTPLVALSTGTNNAFPEIREATVAGLAVGLVATGAVPAASGTVQNKVLRVLVDGRPTDLALVDVCVSRDHWTGARALWKPHELSELFVTSARPEAIGLSAIAGLFAPVERRACHGLWLQLVPPGQGEITLSVPIAPGLIEPVGIAAAREIQPGETCPLQGTRGVVALDGEREIEFCEGGRLAVRLDTDGPVTVDVAAVMRVASERRLLAVSISAGGGGSAAN